MRSRGRIIAMAVIVAAWFALAVFAALHGAAWYVPACYVACGVIIALLLYRTVAPKQKRPATPSANVSDVGRARRSGNPAVRAQANDDDAS